MGTDRRLLAAGLLAALLAGGWLVREVLRAQAPRSGPVPVAWDREACARCRMLISERGFAAQLRGADGRVRHFDDPGCLLLWRDEHEPAAAELHFHHLEEERWVPGGAAVFVPAESTPMAYGLGVRDAGDGLDLAGALRAVQGAEERRQEARRVP